MKIISGARGKLNVSKLFSANMLGVALGVGITVLVSHRLGATEQADAYFMARRLVTSLTELLHRAFLLALLPVLTFEMFSRSTPQHTQMTAWNLRLLAGGAAFVAFIWLVAPFVVDLLGTAMTESARALTVLATRLMVLSVPAVMLASVYTAGLYRFGVYGVPSLLKQLPRILVLLAFAFAGSSFLVETASLAFAAGGFLFMCGCALLIWRQDPDKAGAGKSPGDATRKVSVGVVLLMLAGPQLNNWIEAYFALEIGEGSLTVLELSQGVANLVAAMFVTSAVMPHLADWSHSPENRTPKAFGRTVFAGIGLLACLQGFFMLNAEEIVALLYSHGQLAPGTLEQMADLVMVTAVAPLAVYVFQIVAVWNIAARRRGLFWIVLLAVAASVAARTGLSIALVPGFGLNGLAFTKLVGPLAAVIVIVALGDRGFWPDRRPTRAGWLTLICVVATLAGMHAGQMLATSVASGADVLESAATGVALSALLGSIVFLVSVWRFRLLGYLRM